MPSSVRNSMLAYGYSKDEFADHGGWPYEIYVREARRMVSDYVMTQSNVFNQLVVPDSIGLAGYFTDSHYCQRVVVSGGVRNEGNARGDITSPYPIAYRAIVPKASECVNLLVPWSLSASHTAFSSLRMEPVFMILGQSAGTAACFAIDEGVPVQSINVTRLQSQLLADKQAISSISASAVVVDNADASGVSVVGTWTSSTATTGFYGSDYLHDGNTNKGSSSVTFSPSLPVSGLYQVYTRWTAHVNRATNAPIDIISATGTNTMLVDQTQQGGQWVLLATTNFNAGSSGKVRVRNGGTTRFVVADAVEFLPTTGLPLVNIWATDSMASRWGPRNGSFTISRAGNTNTPLSVGLNFSGPALNGVDFQTIGSSILLPSGVTSTNISLVPFTNSQPVGTKAVTISLATNATYSTGPLAAAAITIKDVPIFDWRLQYFEADATNAAVAADGANPVGDGVPNLVKYALGLDPGQTASKPLLNAIISSNGCFQTSFIRRDPPPPDILYRIETSDDLNSWCSNCVVTKQITFQTNGTATIICEGTLPAAAAPEKFLRVIISRY